MWTKGTQSLATRTQSMATRTHETCVFTPLSSLPLWPGTGGAGSTVNTSALAALSSVSVLHAGWLSPLQQLYRAASRAQETGAGEALPSPWPNGSLLPKLKALTGREPQTLSSIRARSADSRLSTTTPHQ